MKNKTTTIAILLLLTFFSACKKEDTTTPDNVVKEQVQVQQINQVLPQKYIDTLKNLGLTIHNGTNPPIVNGIYICSPLTLKASNIANDNIGMTFSEAKLKIENQNNANFTLNILGKNFLSTSDTSIVSAIAGNGNNFTVYGKVKATNSVGNYIYIAMVMSGTMNGTNIRDFEFGLINIDNSHGEGAFIPEGAARLVYDSDSISVTTDVFRMASISEPSKLKCAANK